MKELYVEGLANHNDRESCVDILQRCSEALTAAHTGKAIEPRNMRSRVLTSSGNAESNIRYPKCEEYLNPAGSNVL